MNAPTKAVEIPISDFGKEAFIQDLLANDPSLLGLGDLVLRDKERVQHSSGRLDLLFESADGSIWYEVEVQLGGTNESHIIRTIEYWDIERRRRPNKTHVAVIVAERITSRFFNVVGLFNQQIPIAAIQMQGYDVGGNKTIIFTSILNHSTPTDETEEAAYQPTDSVYWRNRTSDVIMNIADEILGFTREENNSAEFKYNKGYIRTYLDGQPSRFLTLRPQKKRIRLTLLCPRTIKLDQMIEEAGYDLEYDDTSGRYVFWIYPEDFPVDKEAIRKLIHDSYVAYTESTLETVSA